MAGIVPGMSVAYTDYPSFYGLKRRPWCDFVGPSSVKVSCASFGGTVAGGWNSQFQSPQQLKTAPISLWRGLHGGRAGVGSGEPQLDPLPGPVPFELTVVKKGLCAEPGGLAAMQDGRRDLWAQEA